MRQSSYCTEVGVLPGSDFRVQPKYMDMLNLPEAWQFGRGGGVKVAVIDTGVTPHPRLPHLTAGGDYVMAGGDGLSDCDAHGTMVASMIAAAPATGAAAAEAAGAQAAARSHQRAAAATSAAADHHHVGTAAATADHHHGAGPASGGGSRSAAGVPVAAAAAEGTGRGQSWAWKRHGAKLFRWPTGGRRGPHATPRASSAATARSPGCVQRDSPGCRGNFDSPDEPGVYRQGAIRGRRGPADTTKSDGIRTMARAIVHAANMGASVINISDVTCMSVRNVLDQADLGAAVRYAAVDKDAVIVTAAGDTSKKDCKQNPVFDPLQPNDPRDWNGVNTVVTPSWFSDYVLTVGAVDSSGAPMANMSVAGPWVSIAAPGTDIVGLSPRDNGLVNAVEGPENSLLVPSGTSFSTAIVSGVAALVRAKYPQLSAHQVINRLIRTARAPARGVDNQVGYGVVDPVAALTWDVPDGPVKPPERLSAPLNPPPPPPPRNMAPVWVAAGGLAAALLVAGAVVGGAVLMRRQGRQP